MKNYFIQSLLLQRSINSPEGFIKRSFGYALLLVVATMPFSIKANSASIIILAVFWFSERNIALKWKLFSQRPLVWFFILLYFLFIVGMLYTENMEAGRFNLEKKINLLALPLLIGTSLSYDHAMKRRVLAFFVLICLMASLICLGTGLYHFIVQDDATYLFHEGLTSAIDFHPPYFGMYLSLAIILCLFYLKREWFNLDFPQRISIVILVIYFLFFVLLLSARTSALFLILFFGSGAFYFITKRKMVKEGLIGIMFFLVIIILTVGQSSYLTDRVIRIFTSDISAIDGGRETGLSIRLVKWKCSVQGIKENPFLGIGTGDAIDYLVKCYEKVNFWGMYPEYRFNSHNQYLESSLTLGFVGLISLLVCIILPTIWSLKNKDYMLLSFIALFSFCCLTESLLERHWGVVFFTFFISILSFDNSKNESK